ncbi:1-phosphofructokinase family hexose kinase [Paracoccaceae bacterium Fryx2]|nr:1-phosphofructokinase family hexose kinase [Paracoccaceae bacterium Fryx2]
MIPILTLTLNPALDLSTAVPEVLPGLKLRCAPPRVDSGGGGINVSRAIHILGGESRALVALGGTTGQRVAGLVAAQGIALLPCTAPGETRQSLAVTEDSGRQFRFVLPGEPWPPELVAAAMALILAEARGYVVLSGSQPPGVPDSFPRDLAGHLAGKARLFVDTSGGPLAAIVSTPVPGIELLRMDSEEAEGLAGHPLASRAETADFASGLVARGVARAVIVARGADGSVLADAEGRLFSPAAHVPVVSKVGAGDTFVGAFVLARARGMTPAEALSRGVAAASGAVMTEATELCRREDAERLIAECPVSPV